MRELFKLARAVVRILPETKNSCSTDALVAGIFETAVHYHNINHYSLEYFVKKIKILVFLSLKNHLFLMKTVYYSALFC